VGREECLKYCDDTDGCVTAVYVPSTKECWAKSVNSCEVQSNDLDDRELYEVAQILS